MEDENLITVKQLAGVLNCSPGEVYLLVSAGKLPVIRIGRVLRFEKIEVLKILKNQNQKKEGAHHE